LAKKEKLQNGHLDGETGGRIVVGKDRQSDGKTDNLSTSG
jgi:hypothetical protein